MTSTKTFVQRCADGEADPEDIDDAVGEWHAGASTLPLHSYLGMSEEEYAAWLRDADAITEIVRARSVQQAHT